MPGIKCSPLIHIQTFSDNRMRDRTFLRETFRLRMKSPKSFPKVKIQFFVGNVGRRSRAPRNASKWMAHTSIPLPTQVESSIKSDAFNRLKAVPKPDPLQMNLPGLRVSAGESLCAAPAFSIWGGFLHRMHGDAFTDLFLIGSSFPIKAPI